MDFSRAGRFETPPKLKGDHVPNMTAGMLHFTYVHNYWFQLTDHSTLTYNIYIILAIPKAARYIAFYTGVLHSKLAFPTQQLN